MEKPFLITTPSQFPAKDYPLLIIDKEGSLGLPLAESLKNSFLPLLASKHAASNESGIVHLPYDKKFPTLPNNVFSHVVVIYRGEKKIKKILAKLVTITGKSGSQLLFVMSMYEATPELVEKVKSYKNTRLIIYGDTFGGNEVSSPVAKLLSQAKRHKKVFLENMGLTRVYPLFLQDLITAIVGVVMADNKERVFFASTKARTELSFVRLLKNIDPLLVMDFQQNTTKRKASYIPEDAVHVLPVNSNFDNVLRESLMTNSTKVDLMPEILESSTPRSSNRLFLRSAVFGSLFLLLLPLIIWIFSAVLGFASVGVSAFAFQKGNMGVSKSAAEVGLAFFQTSAPSEQIVATVFETTGITIPSVDIFEKITSGRVVADLLVSTTTAVNTIEGTIRGKSDFSSDKLKLSLKQAVTSLQLLKAQEVLPLIYRQKLEKEERSISFLTNLTDSVPSLLGYEGKKSYAVLVQDNRELRAGGGVIENFAHITFDKGRVEEASVIDSEIADARLKGHLDPPFPLRRFQKVAHWYLKDSAMTLDSAVNATQAAKFIELETGKKVDGVIAVDISFLRSLLELTGPVDLPEFGVKVSKENLFREIALRPKSEFDNNKTQKKDFLTALSESLLQELKNSNASPLALVRIISEGTREKHFLATSLDSSVQPLFFRNALVSSPSITSPKNIIGVMENNLSANKANYFLKRSIVQKVELREDLTASASVAVIYTNTSKSDELGGDYTGFVQFLLPKESKMIGIAINETQQKVVQAITDPTIYTKSLFKEPEGLEVLEEERYEKKLFGFLLKVKKGEERTIVLTYTQNTPLVKDSPYLSYPLSYFKQPGSEQDDYTLELNFASSLVPIHAPPKTQKKGNTLVFQKLIREDEWLQFDFSSKN